MKRRGRLPGRPDRLAFATDDPVRYRLPPQPMTFPDATVQGMVARRGGRLRAGSRRHSRRFVDSLTLGRQRGDRRRTRHSRYGVPGHRPGFQHGWDALPRFGFQHRRNARLRSGRRNIAIAPSHPRVGFRGSPPNQRRLDGFRRRRGLHRSRQVPPGGFRCFRPCSLAQGCLLIRPAERPTAVPRRLAVRTALDRHLPEARLRSFHPTRIEIGPRTGLDRRCRHRCRDPFRVRDRALGTRGAAGVSLHQGPRHQGREIRCSWHNGLSADLGAGRGSRSIQVQRTRCRATQPREESMGRRHRRAGFGGGRNTATRRRSAMAAARFDSASPRPTNASRIGAISSSFR